MKLYKLAKELKISVNDLADMIKNLLPGANSGTEINDELAKEIRALVANSKQPSSSKEAHSTNVSGDANELFETDAPSDTESGIAVLSGMVREYENRIRGLTVAQEWIERHEEVGDYPADPIAAKLTEAVCLLRSLNIPYQPPYPAIKSRLSASPTGSGVALPPLVRSLLEATYPDELTSLDRNLPEQQPSCLQISASQ